MRENNAYCFPLRIAHLLIFIRNGGIRNCTIQPRLKNDTHFSCYDILPKGYNVRPTRPSHYAPMNLSTIFTNMAITAISFNGKYYELTISHGQKHLRPGNLSGFLVKAKLRNLIQHNQPRGSYPCGKDCLTCKYISDGQTSYTFHSTGETRTQHTDCNFKNVIYMVQCNHCSKQYI